MNHKKLGRKLGVRSKHRKAMFRNMATELFRHDRIKTTDTRAKEIRRVAEKIITLAKDGSLHARRRAGSYIKDKEVLSKLFDSVAERYKDRPGGYTRIIKLGYRKGDNSPVSLVELVQEEYKPKAKKKKKKTRPKTTKTDSGKQKKTENGAKSTKKESAKELGLDETSSDESAEKTSAAKNETTQTETKQESVSEEQEQSTTADTETEVKADTKEEEPDGTDEQKSEEPEKGDPDKDKKS